jgi:prepilin-type N-terminal cleavage/methylation domain-containing protein
MPRTRNYCNPSTATTFESGGFTLIEVLVAVSIAAGVISFIVPALLRQVSFGEQTYRLSAVEAVVSSDLEWFSKYTKIWKLSTGSYPSSGSSRLTSAVTRTTSNYSFGGASIYELPLATPENNPCSNGLARALLDDARQLNSSSMLIPSKSRQIYLPPYPINPTGPTRIQRVSTGGDSYLDVYRNIDATGNMIRLSYYVEPVDTADINFKLQSSMYVQAASWCDQSP